ncbi:CDP-alcohol phosphatidyltransferase family protein [Candidatus Falkowbacteria bacterium]|nr:CDP-alcohol phosphatidyltransferase family protein [Candidatus Falkowbacteria bacterium]
MKFIKNAVEFLYDKELLPINRRNLANYITLTGSWVSRLSAYLFFAYFIYFFATDQIIGWLRYLAIGLSGLAAFSDLLDGYIARKNNCVTELGKIFDPHHDKIQYLGKTISLSMDAFVFYLITGEILYPVLAIVLCYITGERDETVGFHRQWASIVSNKIALSARPSGKWRTRLCFPGFPLLHLLIAPFDAPILFTIVSAILISVTVWSLYDYVYGYRKKIREFLKNSAR